MGYSLRSYTPSSLPALAVAGPVTFAGNTTIAGTLGVTGAVTHSSTLAQNGSLTMGSGTQIVAQAGTAGAPGVCVGATNDGLYAISAGLVAIAAGGGAYIYGSNSQCVPNLAMAPELGVTLKNKFTVTPATAQSITGVGVAIAPARMIHEFTSDGNYTLTVAPTIADGADGQLLLLVNVGANTVTLQDQGTLASSNLRLTGNTVALGPRDSIWLYYTGDVGDWVQIGSLVGVL